MEKREAEAVSETNTKAKGRTKEQIYREQMQALGIYEEIFEPEIKTLARVEREYTRAEKAWSATAAPGGKPSFLDPHYAIIQRIRAEVSQHREALGLTPKALKKLTGAAGTDAPNQQDLISNKLDRIAARVAGYDAQEVNPDWWKNDEAGQPVLTLPGSEVPEIQITQDAYETLPEAQEAARISDLMDEELRRAVHEDMG